MPVSANSLSYSRRAVFLDRDGVLNRAPVRGGRPLSPSRLEEVELLPGVPEACARLHDGGFRLIVVTNQPEVARGRLSRETVEAIHEFLRGRLPSTTCVSATTTTAPVRLPQAEARHAAGCGHSGIMCHSR